MYTDEAASEKESLLPAAKREELCRIGDTVGGGFNQACLALELRKLRSSVFHCTWMMR